MDDIKMTAYDIAKQMVAAMPVPQENEYDNHLNNIVSWIKNKGNDLYLLFNKERSDFTVLKNDICNSIEYGCSELKEALNNRGEFRFAEYEDANKTYEIWLSTEEGIICYMLMPWDDCTMEV